MSETIRLIDGPRDGEVIEWQGGDTLYLPGKQDVSFMFKHSPHLFQEPSYIKLSKHVYKRWTSIHPHSDKTHWFVYQGVEE